MNNLLLWFGRLAGVVGLLLIAVAAVVRMKGVYWLGSFQVGTLLLGGTGAGCRLLRAAARPDVTIGLTRCA